FLQDNFKLRPRLSLELGLRYDWNMTPSERYDRFVVFDSKSVSLIRAGKDLDEIYRQNNKNFQPRVGFAWDPSGRGKTVMRGAYGILVEQPLGSSITPIGANPPLE